jgi:hypothetical protein
MRYPVFFLVFVSLSLSLNATSKPAYAETVEERCEASTNDSSAYRQCVQSETSKALSALSGTGTDVLCKGTTCIHRLVYEKSTNRFIGKELTMEIRPAEAGREYVIVDAKKRTTVYEQCGSCRSIEYGTGPLYDVTIRPDTDSAFMVTVRSRQ